MENHTRHTFAIEPDVYWQRVHFDDAYVRGLYLEGLGFEAVECVELRHEDDGSVHRRLHVTPRLDMPEIVRVAMRSRTEYDEIGRFDAATGRWTFDVRSAGLPDRLQVGGVMYFGEPDANGSPLIRELHFHARLPAVGRAIERLIARSYADNAEREAAWLRRWIADERVPSTP